MSGTLYSNKSDVQVSNTLANWAFQLNHITISTQQICCQLEIDSLNCFLHNLVLRMTFSLFLLVKWSLDWLTLGPLNCTWGVSPSNLISAALLPSPVPSHQLFDLHTHTHSLSLSLIFFPGWLPENQIPRWGWSYCCAFKFIQFNIK